MISVEKMCITDQHETIDHATLIRNTYREVDGKVPSINKVDAFLRHEDGSIIEPHEVKVIFVGKQAYKNAKWSLGHAFVHDEYITSSRYMKTFSNLVRLATGKSPSGKFDWRKWTRQGLMLINRSLTHMDENKFVWDHVVRCILFHYLESNRNIVVVTFGNDAEYLIDKMQLDFIFRISIKHPNTLKTASQFKIAEKEFAKINKRLKSLNTEPIEW